MQQQRPLILITNDDSHTAKGLKKLSDLMRQLGDVVVVSTEAVMSSKSHSATLFQPLYVRLVDEEPGYQEYLCNGTPVDCIKLGYELILSRRPDLVVSGINHGTNAGSTVLYSGTVGAVVEACMDGTAGNWSRCKPGVHSAAAWTHWNTTASTWTPLRPCSRNTNSTAS